MKKENNKAEAKEYKLNVVAVRLVKDAPIMSGHPIKSPEDAVELIGKELCELDREVVCILHMKANGKPISCTFASMGAIDSSIAHPRELLKAAILSNSASMILIHNHPSGDIHCSEQDTMLTQRMIDICDLVGIPLLDSVIVGGDNSEYFSYKEKNMLPMPRRNICVDYQNVEFKIPVAAEISSYLDNDRKETESSLGTDIGTDIGTSEAESKDLVETNTSRGGRKR